MIDTEMPPITTDRTMQRIDPYEENGFQMHGKNNMHSRNTPHLTRFTPGFSSIDSKVMKKEVGAYNSFHHVNDNSLIQFDKQVIRIDQLFNYNSPSGIR